MLGVEHILRGIDHLLFVLALLILLQGTRRLVATVTAFTVAHSITLAAATLGCHPCTRSAGRGLHRAQHRLRRRGDRPGSARPPGHYGARAVARRLRFGLLHGLGFAGALGEVGLPQNAIPLALLFFNVGVEIGQLLFIGGAGLLVIIALRRVPGLAKAQAVRLGTAYAIGSLGAFWAISRIATFLS